MQLKHYWDAGALRQIIQFLFCHVFFFCIIAGWLNAFVMFVYHPRVTIVHHRCLFKIILLRFCNYALEKTYQAFVLLSFFIDIFVGDFAVQTLNFLSPLNCRYITLDIIICELCSLWSDFESCFKASEAYSGYHEHLLHHHHAKH